MFSEKLFRTGGNGECPFRVGGAFRSEPGRRVHMKSNVLRKLALGASVAAVMSVSAASAAELSQWVRASGAGAAQHMIDLWNSNHNDKITLTVIPDDQMVTKLATGVQGGEVPDLISFDLIYMPDFMRAGFLVDLTDQ